MSSVPFSIAHPGPLSVDQVQGVARVDAEALVLEFRTVDGVLGKAKSEAREVSLNLSDLESVSHRRGWLSDTFTITTRRISSLESVPGARGPELTLRCRRKYRKAAESVASTLRLLIADRHLADLRRGPTSGCS